EVLAPSPIDTLGTARNKAFTSGVGKKWIRTAVGCYRHVIIINKVIDVGYFDHPPVIRVVNHEVVFEEPIRPVLSVARNTPDHTVKLVIYPFFTIRTHKIIRINFSVKVQAV